MPRVSLYDNVMQYEGLTEGTLSTFTQDLSIAGHEWNTMSS